MLQRLQFSRAAVLAALLLMAVPAVAQADGGPPSFVVGPIQVRHGYTVEVNGFGCGSKFVSGTITFTKTVGAAIESHTYSGGKLKCKVAKNLSTGSLTFALGRFAKVDITFRKHGRATREPLPPGCTGHRPLTQGGKATGTFKSSIENRFFGRVNSHRTQASVTKIDYKCTGTKLNPKNVFLGAGRGTEASGVNVNASRIVKQPRTATLSTYGRFKKLFSQFHTMFLSGGKSVFNFAQNLSKATITGDGKLVSGQLKFKANPLCKGANRTGTLTGRLTAHFDVGGRKVYKGSGFRTPDLYRETAGPPCSG